jgi:lipopolysaccharide export system permease protein
MIKLIDRQMIRGYFKAYAVCLLSLLSLYVVVDLFTNLDDFTKREKGVLAAVRQIITYYGFKTPQIFDRLCEAIVLLSAMFTVAWMQRNNEQVPLLSAGVSTRRIVLPVLLSAWSMLSLTVLNQELVIPRIGNRLLYDKDDPGGEKDMTVRGAWEPNLIHVEGERASRKGLTVKEMRITIPESVAGNLLHLTAQEAHYFPPGSVRDDGQRTKDGAPSGSPAVTRPSSPREGGWELTGTRPELDPIEGVLDKIDIGRYFLHTRDVDFEALTRHPNWYLLASTWRLYEELQRPESTRLAPMAVLFHTRLTRPLLGMLLVFLGLAVILRDQNRNVIISSGMCLVLCGVFFAAIYSCKMLGDNDVLAPTMAAWLPVLCFGPLALVLFDAVHT